MHENFSLALSGRVVSRQCGAIRFAIAPYVLVENTVLGGAASVAGGGKFANGAATGAFGYLFNNCYSCLQRFNNDPDKLGVISDTLSPFDFINPRGWLLALSEIGTGTVAAEGAGLATTTVGRYMSQAELDAMTASGRVRESFNNGVTSVTVPPNPGLYRAAPTSDTFTQFDVPTSSLNGVGTGTAKIYGPNSIFGPRLGITEMPPATNIVVP